MRIPGPKWGAGRPPLETPKSSLARQTWPNSSPLARLELRCRWGRPRARARSPRLPHLHRFVWGLRPLAPKVPQWGRLPIMRACWGLRPFAPCVPQRGASASHARLRASPSGPQGSQTRKVRRSCANAHGITFVVAFAATPPQICAEAPAAKRLGVPSLPLARLWPQATLARPQRGNPKGGAALFGLSLPTFCRSRK